MTDTAKSAALDGLCFFGKISAAISHDLKNTLSIMNESAGLLEDLALLAQKGRPLDPRRIQQLGATIKRQIRRNDGIVRNMNRFAHSVDQEFKAVDLGAWLEVLLAICRRLTDAGGVKVSIAQRHKDVSIVTRPFYLFHFVWLLLEWGMDYAGPGKNLLLEVEPDQDGVRLICRGFDALTEEVAGQDPSPQWLDLSELLQARTEIAADQKTIVAVFPFRIDG